MTAPTHEAERPPDATASVELVIEGRMRSIGPVEVRRVLPYAHRRLVGPFVFFDHLGPLERPAGTTIDVRPHPHIGIATVTYLFEGEVLHQDSLGTKQRIRPGDVNWMIAGSGIVHSERTPPELRDVSGRAHGIQSWVALPIADEESAPRFEHHPARALPILEQPGVRLQVIVGTAYGARAPATVLSPTLYVHARLDPGATLAIDGTHEERAGYVVEGALFCDDTEYGPGTMLVFRRGVEATVRSVTGASVMLVGGAKLDGERHIYWNFVTSTQDRMERAKSDWRDRRFPPIPGDDEEFVPLPDD